MKGIQQLITIGFRYLRNCYHPPSVNLAKRGEALPRYGYRTCMLVLARSCSGDNILCNDATALWHWDSKTLEEALPDMKNLKTILDLLWQVFHVLAVLGWK